MDLFLFDIDGTLLSSDRAGMDAMDRAFEDVYGIANGFRGVTMAGKTDLLILREALQECCIERKEEQVAEFLERYTFHLRRTLGEPRRRLRIMPGIPELLDELEARDDVLLGLLTGNCLEGARLKLEKNDLWSRFRLGAYGSDAEDRNELPVIARSRAVSLRKDPIERTLVIGDTPRDIECARRNQALSVAVATGTYSRRDLLAHEPDHCFPDLSDTKTVLGQLLAAG